VPVQNGLFLRVKTVVHVWHSQIANVDHCYAKEKHSAAMVPGVKAAAAYFAGATAIAITAGHHYGERNKR
jgi:hypothetical protein